MFTTHKSLILASASPRRQKFLMDLGLDFTCLPADIDETPESGELPADFAQRMAVEKASLIAQLHPNSYVIGADTVVTIDNLILGKPNDEDHALKILRSLQGKTHQVITGLSIICLREHCLEQLTRSTDVTFATFPDSILSAYIQAGESLDKAGAYGIQSKGAFLSRSINGSCSNVIGFPVNVCVSLLLQHDVITPRR